jgi:SAM-dependent methyltransferase
MLDETKRFYDDLAPYYDLIFEDWNTSMARQGEAIATMIAAELGQFQPREIWVLDAACGIGTQTLPLADRGFHLTARDVSGTAIARLRREADVRGLVVDAAVADMREVAATVSRSFDAVLAFDNSISHLLDDEDLLAAFRNFLAVLRPGGIFLCSVRDYDKVRRGEPATHVYGQRQRGGETFHLRQEWTWADPMHYKATFVIEKQTAGRSTTVLSSVSQFHAVSTRQLLELMQEVGFLNVRRIDDTIYQPILSGRKAAE